MTYRRRLTEYQAKGWRMNLAEMANNQGRVAYAIPSPARRDHAQDWVVTPVPLIGTP